MSRTTFAFLVCAPITLAACTSSIEEGDGESTAELTMTEGNARVVGTGGMGLRVRRQPNATSATIGVVREGAPVAVYCRARGQAIAGNPYWDYLDQVNGWISERYVQFEVSSVPACEMAGPAPAQPQAPRAPRGSVGGTQMQAAIVAEARRWIGTRESANCQPFSTALSRPCEPWCADFVEYVWQQSGADIGGLNAWAGTFFDYGEANGTSKPRTATDVAPGDAVVFGRGTWEVAHVGIVSEVFDNGDMLVVNGNWADSVLEERMTRGTVVGGYGIGAFVSPVPRR